MEPLLPVRHPNRDFFVCDIFDSMPGFRDDRASMEHPIFSLSTKPDMRTLEYGHNGCTVKIIPSTMGLATIHDKDVLLYVVSYLHAAMQEDRDISQTVRLIAHDLLVSTNRPTVGVGYERLEAVPMQLHSRFIRPPGECEARGGTSCSRRSRQDRDPPAGGRKDAAAPGI